MDGRGSCWGIDEAKETDGVEGEAIWEWEVAEEVRHGCKQGESSPWTSKEVFACVYRRSRKTNRERAFDCLSAVGGRPTGMAPGRLVEHRCRRCEGGDSGSVGGGREADGICGVYDGQG